MAPEVLGSEGYGLARDVWSVGVVLFMLLTGKAPFDGANEITICKAILSKDIGETISKECAHLSMEAQELLRALLSRNPKSRPSAREALGFAWFRTNSWTDDSSPPEEEENWIIIFKMLLTIRHGERADLVVPQPPIKILFDAHLTDTGSTLSHNYAIPSRSLIILCILP